MIQLELDVGRVEVDTSSPISVREIDAKLTHEWILTRHYAKRLCPITYSFGAFRGQWLVGVVTYSTPSTHPIKSGICGPEFKDYVLELNRLVCENTKNVASTLIGRSLKMLPKPRIVVSFADTSQGHVGYVYQATNFIYTGLSAKRTDMRIKGAEHLHGATISDQSRGKANRAEWVRNKYGDAVYMQDRPRKHRYITFLGDRQFKNAAALALRYKVEPYPKIGARDCAAAIRARGKG